MVMSINNIFHKNTKHKHFGYQHMDTILLSKTNNNIMFVCSKADLFLKSMYIISFKNLTNSLVARIFHHPTY